MDNHATNPAKENRKVFSEDIDAINQKLYTLTIREWEVVILIVDGLSTNEIARDLIIEAKSVQNYKRRICKKLKLTGRKLTWFCYTNQEHIRSFYKIVKARS